MSNLHHPSNRLCYTVIGHAMTVLFIGLIAGIFLIFSLLDAVTLWPLPAWEVRIPGSTRGWQAAHVGGILNGVMIAVGALLMTKLQLEGQSARWVGWGSSLRAGRIRFSIGRGTLHRTAGFRSAQRLLVTGIWPAPLHS